MSKGRVVVIGAGVAGLVTTRVLAEHAEHVTVIERNVLEDDAEPRRGVPQGRHAHGLLASGEAVLRELFPGMIEELVAGGGQVVSMRQITWWQGGGYRAPSTAPDSIFFSRPYLELGIRRRVMALPNVSVVHAGVEGLEFAQGRVVAVNVDGGDGLASVAADLVVDTSGRSSRVGTWLSAGGFAEPPVSQVHIDMGYASRLYRRTPGRLPEGSCMIIIGSPPDSKRLGVAFPIDGDRWIVTLCGMHGDHAPTDDEGFLAFARSLPTGDVAGVIASEEPLGPIMTHRLGSDQWRHFEKVSRHPAGFLALGDSICSFNPIYGQGMSSASLQALALRAQVERHGLSSPSLPRAFYKAAAKVIKNPWAVAAGGDFTFPETTGEKPPMVDRINAYIGKAFVAAQHDPVVAAAVFDVLNLQASPPSLMKPSMVLRVRRGSKLGPTGNPTPMTAGV